MKEYKFKINGGSYAVCVNAVSDSSAQVTVNGTPYTVELEPQPESPVQENNIVVASSAPKVSGSAHTMTAPLPGTILRIEVAAGQAVCKGQKLAVLEAMKMENDILAECDGTVREILVAAGDTVPEGAGLIVIG